MSIRTLFLAWQDVKSRRWFPVGRLETNLQSNAYKFCYTKGAEQAAATAKFEPLTDFPDFEGIYQSVDLFPLFKNRVLSPGRPDFLEYLKQLDLDETASPAEILAIGGGGRATDALEVFPKLERGSDGRFCCRFFLHGSRYVSGAAQERLKTIEPGEELGVAVELSNPVTQHAIQIQTNDYHVIGWAPRYLLEDIMKTLAKSHGEFELIVVKLNPPPAPAKQRLLIELKSSWPDHEPMTGGVFAPFSSNLEA